MNWIKRVKHSILQFPLEIVHEKLLINMKGLSTCMASLHLLYLLNDLVNVQISL